MSQTKMHAGRLVAIYVDDGLGRRLLLASRAPTGLLERPIVAAFTRADARALIATLTQLAEELPEE